MSPAGSAVALAADGGGILAPQAGAAEFTVKPVERPDYKAVFGRVESRDLVPARARLGGTILSLSVEEGSAVKAGDVVAVVVDDKLALELGALDARLKALDAELNNANADLERAQKLLETGVVPRKQVEGFQTRVDVLTNQRVPRRWPNAPCCEQQRSEGEVIAPAPGRVLSVPVTKGSVVMAGETIARIAGGGYFLRLSLPERHAGQVKTGDEVLVGSRGMTGSRREGPGSPRQGHQGLSGDRRRPRAGRCRGRGPRRLLRGRAHACLDSRGAAADDCRSGRGHRHPLRRRLCARGAAFGRGRRCRSSPARDSRRTTEHFTEILTGLAAGDRVVMP